MLVQFGNNWIKKIPRTAKLDSGRGRIWQSSEFFESYYFQIGQHVVLLHVLILLLLYIREHCKVHLEPSLTFEVARQKKNCRNVFLVWCDFGKVAKNQTHTGQGKSPNPFLYTY